MKKFYLLGLALSLALSVRAENKDGFTPLFNGKDFSNFYIVSGGSSKTNFDPHHLFQVHDGMVHMYKDAPDGSKQPNGYIITEKEYSNYHLRFQYKWGKKIFASKIGQKRDAGVLYHCWGKDEVWPNGVELQVQETDTGDIFTVNTRVTTTVDPATTNLLTTFTTNNNTKVVRTNVMSQPYFKEAAEGGILYTQGTGTGIRRLHRSHDCDIPEWNTVELIAEGDHATYIVNGKINNRIQHIERTKAGKWIPLTKGKILFQQEGAEVFYRNIEIKMLPEKK